MYVCYLEMTEKSEALSSQLSANKIETSKLLEEKSHLSKEISEAKKAITVVKELTLQSLLAYDLISW